MRKSLTRKQTFTRRAFVFAGLQGAALSVLVGRLYYLQFIKSTDYRTLAEDNRIKLQLVIPPRGALTDRNGLAMALNDKNYRVLLEPGKKENLRPILDKLAPILNLSDGDIEKLLATMPSSLSAPAVLVKEHLEWEELAKVEFTAPDLPGVIVDSGQMRYYPLAAKAAHLIGYVGAVSEKEREKNQPLLRLPDFRIGKTGAEKLFEQEVRGSAGMRQIEVNAHGQPVRELSTKPSEPGVNLKLTIDRRLQEYAAERLGEESGSIIVMDVTNGDVTALASMPAYDPNIFSKGIPHDYWRELNGNPRTPLLNKALSGQYPPGSTFKMMVGLAGLKAGVVNASSRISCPGFFMLGKHRFNCWKPEGHGSVALHDALAVSCDTYFYTLGQRLGIDAIAAMSREFGLGEMPGTGLLSEKKGVMPTEIWKMKSYKDQWRTGDSVNAAIGQGYVLSTPMQLAIMTARLASGKKVVPRLHLPETSEPLQSFAPLDIDPAFFPIIQAGMAAVVNESYGTAFGKRIHEPNYAMAGKTGTSQVRRITVRGRDQNSLPWEARHHAWFVGYAPVEIPRYAVSVLIEHGGGGSSAAAPVARDVLLKAQQLAETPVSDDDRMNSFIHRL